MNNNELRNSRLDHAPSNNNRGRNVCKDEKNILSICLINARSVMPKLYSLVNTLEELRTDICVLTEMWIREDRKIKEQLEDLECLTGYKMICRDREDRRGGRVAIYIGSL